jgi:hypothetical protein
MPKRTAPAKPKAPRSPRKKPVKRTKAPPPQAEAPLKSRVGDMPAVVLKEESRGGLTAKELQRRLAVRAAVSPAFIDALRRDFARHGAVAIAKTRELSPATYVRLAAVLLPMDAEAAEAVPEIAASEENATGVARRIAELRAFLARERAETAQGEASEV